MLSLLPEASYDMTSGAQMSTTGNYKIDASDKKRFLWRSYPKAQHFLEGQLSNFLVPAKASASSSDPFLETLVLRDAAAECGLRFFDLLDYVRLAVPRSARMLIVQQGFIPQEFSQEPGRLYAHEEAIFPALYIEEVKSEKASAVLEIALKVEDLEQLQKKRKYSGSVSGEVESSFRKMSWVGPRGSYRLTFVERKGHRNFLEGPKEDLKNLREVRYLFGPHRDTQIRPLEDVEAAFDRTFEIVEKAMTLVGRERAAYEWLQAEVRYWEQRNKAATLQGERQRALGLGWMNKDHMTYRNSKAMFPRTVELLSRLGFEKRERLHAEEFTAQILENRALGVAAFVDVDPREKKEIGTVGLWVKVHGESLLIAGLHHMAARFDFVNVQEILGRHGITFRPPFSNFDELKQVFTEGEKRLIPERHAKRLYKNGFITQLQYQRYVTEGAIYTHLENIQRRNGFKGFNPQSVDVTLRDTGKSLRLKGR